MTKYSRIIILIVFLTVLTIMPQAIANNPQDDPLSKENLIAYYDFSNNSSLEVWDQSQNQNDGLMKNMDLNNYLDIAGMSALIFEGVDDYVEVPHDDSLNVDEITVGGWFKLDGSTGGLQNFIRKDGSYSLFYHDDDDGVGLGIWIGEEYRQVVSDVGLDAIKKEWRHIMGTYDGSKLKIWVDGEEVASTSRDGSIDDSTTKLTLGSREGKTNWYNGLMSDVRIYNRALTEDEIQKINRTTGPILRTKDIERNVNWRKNSRNEYQLEFDGVDDYVEVPHDDSLNVDEITVGGWFKLDGSTGGLQNFIRKDGSYSLFYHDDDDGVGLGIWIGEEYRQVVSDVGLDAIKKEWRHIMGTYDGSKLKIWVDGEEVASTSRDGSIDDSTTKLTLGSREGKTNWYNGLMSDVRIYNRALTEDEIQRLHDGSEVGDDLVVYFPLAEGIGKRVYDRSPNELVGRIHSKVRVRETLELLAGFYRVDREDDITDFDVDFSVYADDRQAHSERLDSSEIEPGSERLVGLSWVPDDIRDYEVKAVLEYGGGVFSSRRVFNVGPPLNPPIHYLYASAVDTGEGIDLVLEPWSPWQEEYDTIDWSVPFEVRVYRERLLRDEETLEKTYRMNDSPFNFKIPYNEFYTNDGIYRIEFKLSNDHPEDTTEVSVKVSGEDGIYNPPNELARILTIIGIPIAMILAYMVKKRYD